MDQNIQSNQKDHSKSALWSFWLGVIVLALVALFYLLYITSSWTAASFWPENQSLLRKVILGVIGFLIFLVLVGWLLTIPGFILGIIGIVSSKRKLAIIGIVLCVVAFLLSSFFIWTGGFKYRPISEDERLSHLGVRKNDTLICDKIQYAGWKRSCYAHIAERSNDSSICEKIENQTERNGCLVDLAINTHDTSLCDKVDFNYHDGCLGKTPCRNDFYFNRDACYWGAIPLGDINYPNDLNLLKQWCPFFKSDVFIKECNFALHSLGSK